MNAISSAGRGADASFLGLDVGGAPQQKVEEAARQFEGFFVSMLMKTMRETMASELFSGDGADVWGSVFDETMGNEIAKAGGLGLIDQLQPRTLSISA